MQWRNGGIHVTVLDEWTHVTVEQREQQNADMCAIDIGIGHHDDFVVSCLLDIETGPGTRADHLNDGCAFLVRQHLRQ